MMKRMMVMAVAAMTVSGAMGLTMEDPISTGGWAATWSSTMSWDMLITGTNTVTSTWSGELAAPGAQVSPYMNKWYFRTESDYTLETPLADVTKWGIEWIDPSWSGKPADKAVIAAYITPGIILGQETHSDFEQWGFQAYRPWLYAWENKDYFKTYARVAAVNGQGAEFCIRSYSYNLNNTPPSPWNDKSICTLLSETKIPLSGVDYQWQDFQYAVAKPTDGDPNTHAWFELSIVNGNANTVVYIDECRMTSDEEVTLFETDFNHNFEVYKEDLQYFASQWLTNGPVVEPRDSGLLVNGDFYLDLNIAEPNDPVYKYPGYAPTGWTFSGSAGSGGEYGLAYMGNKGYMNFDWTEQKVVTPLGGSVAAYTTDPGYVLQQTTSANAVSGQTYYAMMYFMTHQDGTYAWKDLVVMSLEIGGVEVASFERVVTKGRWRPLYGTYTAQPADNGKPITLKITYNDTVTNTAGDPPGTVYYGYVTLDTTMPAEWPEARSNELVNGGFDDIDFLLGLAEPYPNLHHYLVDADNYGSNVTEAAFLPVPALPGWVYEVPAGYNFVNQFGMWGMSYYGSPLPTPGLHDVTVRTTNTLHMGQVVGALQEGQTYYLDMACGAAGHSTFPSPAPQFHLELWQIPAGVTNGTTIHTGINPGGTPASGYVKLTEAVADSTGDVLYVATGVPASKWQLMGTTYTATAADTNVYVRVYGSGGNVAGAPEFIFSDVYLSTEPRLVPGGEVTFSIAEGMTYDVGGPYSCPHLDVMGGASADVNGDCFVSLEDYVMLVNEWLDYAFVMP